MKEKKKNVRKIERGAIRRCWIMRFAVMRIKFSRKLEKKRKTSNLIFDETFHSVIKRFKV